MNATILSPSSLDALISLRLACHANLPAMLDSDWGVLTPAGNGLTPLEPCGSFDHSTQSLRTHQLSLLSKEGGPSTELCRNWSRSGMICGGTYFPLPRLVRVTCENDSSLSLPTPTSSKLPTTTCNDGQKRGDAYWKDPRKDTTFEDNLPRALRRQLTLPTPTRDWMRKYFPAYAEGGTW